MTRKAFVDTTVLADALLKPDERSRRALRALQAFDDAAMPGYALKEFRSGPLYGFVWFHNTLVETRGVAPTIERLRRLAFRRGLQATTLEALEGGLDAMGLAQLAVLEREYGATATHDAMLYDRIRLHVKTLVLKAWKRRRKLVSRVVCELGCFEEDDPTETPAGTLAFKRFGCDPRTTGCATADCLRERGEATGRVRRELLPEDGRGTRQTGLLRRILRGRAAAITSDDCRALGDAVFAILAPDGWTILTTNISDHRPLAEAVGKSACTPEEASRP